MDHGDKRLNPRITIRDDVTLVTSGTTSDEICTLENISVGGIKFFAVRQLATGSPTVLRVPSDDDTPDIIIHATIIRCEPGAHGKPYGYACIINGTENA